MNSQFFFPMALGRMVFSTKLTPTTEGVSYRSGEQEIMSGGRVWDNAGRLSSIEWKAGTQVLDAHSYLLDVAGRRAQAVHANGERTAYTYNKRGEVTGSARTDAQGSAKPGGQFGYAYDAIGNRLASTKRSVADNSVLGTTYEVNDLNQYTQRTVPDPARRAVRGSAHPEATVRVKTYAPGATEPEQNLLAFREGAEFTAEPTVPNSQAGTHADQNWRKLQIEASRAGVGVNGGTVTTKRDEGGLWFPPEEENYTYDADGNLLTDARWTYTWDAENRLTQMQTTPAAAAKGIPNQRLSFTYDSQSRRVRKVVESFDIQQSSFVIASDTRFLYDGWNLVAEFEMNQQSQILNLKSTYAWGLDLSGTEQGAGGVGGWLFAVNHSALSTLNSELTALAPCYDGNGNIATGQVMSRHEYDAFGNELSIDSALTVTLTSGSGSSALPAFKFSTKYTDAETGLCYYGYRYMSPELGRWLNRDPIEERGGLNLYAAFKNDGNNKIDVLGKALPLLVLPWVGGFTVSTTGACCLVGGATALTIGAMEYDRRNTQCFIINEEAAREAAKEKCLTQCTLDSVERLKKCDELYPDDEVAWANCSNEDAEKFQKCVDGCG